MSIDTLNQTNKLSELIKTRFDKTMNPIAEWNSETAQAKFQQTNEIRTQAGIFLFSDKENEQLYSGERDALVALRAKYATNEQENTSLARYLAATSVIAGEYYQQDNPVGVLAGMEGLDLLDAALVNQIPNKKEKLLLQKRLIDSLEERMRIAIHFEHDFKLAESLGSQLKEVVQNMDGELIETSFLLAGPLDMLAISQYQTKGFEAALQTLETVNPIFASQLLGHYVTELEILLEEARQQSDSEALSIIEKQTRELLAAFTNDGKLSKILNTARAEMGESSSEELSLIRLQTEKNLLIALIAKGAINDYADLKNQLIPKWTALAKNHAFEVTDFQAQLLVAEAESKESDSKLKAYQNAMELFQGIGLDFHVAEVGLRCADCVDDKGEKKTLFLKHWSTLGPLVETEVMQAFDENPVPPHSPQGQRAVRVIEAIYAQPEKNKPDILHDMLRDVGRQAVLQFRRASKASIESDREEDLFKKLQKVLGIEQLIICQRENGAEEFSLKKSFGAEQTDLDQNLLNHPQLQRAIDDAQQTDCLTQITNIYGDNEQARNPIRQVVCIPQDNDVLVTHKGEKIVPLTFTQQAALRIAIDEYRGGEKFNGSLERAMRSMVQTGRTRRGEEKYNATQKVLNRIYREVFVWSTVTHSQILVYAEIPSQTREKEKIVGGLAVKPLKKQEKSLVEIFGSGQNLWNDIPREQHSEFGSYGVMPIFRSILPDLLYVQMIKTSQAEGCTHGIMTADTMVINSFKKMGIKIIDVDSVDITNDRVSKNLLDIGVDLEKQRLFQKYYFDKFGEEGSRIIKIDFKQALSTLAEYQKNF